MEEKAKKICGFVFAGVVAVGLVLAIVGMFTNIVSNSLGGESLFGDTWGQSVTIMGQTIGSPSNVFAIIAFIVTLVGLGLALVGAILRVFLNKSMKILDLLGGVLAIVGGILVLVACIILANDDFFMNAVNVGAGAILAFIGGILGGVCAILPQIGPFKA